LTRSLAILAPLLAHSQTLDIAQAVGQAAEKYGAVRVSTERIAEATAGINLARQAFLPRADFLAQANRATRNNIYGMLLPQQVIAPISGPPNPINSLSSVFGSATGFLVSWEPFDFGLRRANVDAATAAQRRAEASAERTRFDVAASAADAFLTILAAQQAAVAAKAQVDRARVLNDVAGALVKAELRPGVDASRTRAELAMAESARIQAEQAVNVARASLAQFLDRPPAEVAIDAGRLLQDPSKIDAVEAGSPGHPEVREQQAAIDESKARQKALDKTYYPKFSTQGTLYARGTGARTGLGPNIHNWGLGITMTLPVTEYLTLRVKREAEAARERTESARLLQVRQDLAGKLERAKAMLNGAKQIARNTPVQLEAARANVEQATARYKAGLAGVVDVAEAQRLLAQTEIDDALARLQIWRALLSIAAAQGDLKPFLDQAVGK
jgi:outer membrane protein TolC